jgi:hypothetical protein
MRVGENRDSGGSGIEGRNQHTAPESFGGGGDGIDIFDSEGDAPM